jgi:sorbitol-specific phosphotransferase system component IIA
MNNNNNKTLLVFLTIVATFGMVTIYSTTTTTIQRAVAELSSDGAANITNTTNTTHPLTLGNPYYVEYDKTTSQKAVVINGTTNATEITFSGHGTAKDINFTDNGNGLIIPRDTKGSAVLLQGNINLTTTSGDKASLDFKELGHVDANGMVKANGAAFFDPNATGRLAYLSNTVSIYTDEVDKAGNGKVLAWEWNK